MTQAKRIGRAGPAATAADGSDRQGLSSRLKEAREYLGLSQDEVAKALDLPRSAVSLMETGQRKVDAIELKRLAEIYQRPIAYFTGDAGEPAVMPETVQHLARTAAKLTDRDREELLQFAQFLQERKR
jgi:transcriptional regulator with XRE-family HTH domain